ncbi:MAG: M23 family metallopeptidase [Rhodobacteraceae bacterium]|nr:M23 family metallopeptidase [Paracoccaceae bacterium]
MHLGSFQSQHIKAIDLGDEAPLVIQDDMSVLPDRRSVSLRWLSGTILTGVTSIVLMGGALVAALDGQYSVSAATAPNAKSANSDILDQGIATGKGDKILLPAAEYSKKQTIPVNVVTREGSREHIKVRNYTLVTSSLATRKNAKLATQIPAFNPLNMFSDTQAVSEKLTPQSLYSDSIYGAKVQGEITIALSKFPTDSPLISNTGGPSEEDVERTVRETARFLVVTPSAADTQTLVDPARFDFNLARQSEFERLAVRITPENVSFVSKRGDENRLAGMDEKIVPIAAETEIMDALLDNDATEAEAAAIQDAMSKNFGIDRLQQGNRLRLAYSQTPGGRLRPERVSIYSDTVHKATVALSDSGTYVSATAPTTFLADAFAEADRISYGGQTPVLYTSLYQTALEQGISSTLIDELIRIFAFDVDFNARVQPGDSLEVFYAESENAQANEILYAALNTGASNRRFYRFHTPDDGELDFYDGNGQSANKFLMRKPVSDGQFRSGFGMRRHPILKYRKMHTGVDWAAKRGTPIMAAGNGVIKKAGWSSSYGRRIELSHANGYTTTYNHMTAFAKGITEGMRVSQGQIIGYVGSTGLSTGPHLHYEVMVNNRYVDPMRIRLPRGRILDGEMLDKFEAERARIDSLLERGRRPSLIATAQQ